MTPSDAVSAPSALNVTLSGSFRRDPDLLRSEFDALRALGCEILSPQSLDFVDERDGFVITAEAVHLTPPQIERQHLDAISLSHFVWLHLPEGYLGRSGALELGFADALGIPVFAARDVNEVGLQELVQVVANPAEAVSRVRERFARS